MLLGITSGKPGSKERDYVDVQTFFFLKEGVVEACLVTEVQTTGSQISGMMERESRVFNQLSSGKNKVKKVGHASIVQSWWQAATLLFSMLSLCM
jgi:hypothetical protein